MTPVAEKLFNIFKNNTFTQVLSIKKEKDVKHVYDLSVPENENFIAGIGQIYAHNSASTRFALLDLKHFPNKAKVQGIGKSVYYTNSDHLRYSADISLMERISKQAEFHPIVQGGVMTHIWLGESNPEKEALWKFTKNIALNTDTAYFAFTKDFTNCLNCKKFSPGIFNKCPHCGATEPKLEWFSRITGYYSRLNSWNDGKIQEWRDRKRYDLNKN